MKKSLLITLLFTASLLVSNFAGAQSFADNIVSQWTFDSETAVDSKTGVEGTLVGEGLGYTDGVAGKAIDFSSFTTGTIAGIVVKDDGGDLSAIDFPTESFTVGLWAIVDPSAEEQVQIIKGTNGADATDFDGNLVNNANGHRWTIQTKQGEIRFAIDDDLNKTQLGVDIATLSTPYPAGEWVHIVGVRNRDTGFLYLYLNGAMIGEAMDATGDLNIAGQDFVIGNYVTGANVSMGPIDEVNIINKALSADEVMELYEMSTKATDIAAAKVKAIPVEGGIKLPGNSNASVYSISGKMIADHVNSEFLSISKGMYIVKIGSSASKVMVTR